jgi:hypothetical protein
MSRPPLPWSTLLAVAAVGALLLAFFHARAGGSVGVVAALAIAAVLTVCAVLASRRDPGGRRPRPAIPRLERTPRPESPARAPRRDGSQPVARDIAERAASAVAAPAAAVLMSHEGKLVATGTAGDWGTARRALGDLATAGPHDPAQDAGDPPEFILDPRSDVLQRLLGLYARPIPMERWRELSDVPAPFLPLVGLAASGVGVAVALSHRRRLAGLLVVARRAPESPYDDDELAALQRLAQESGRALGAALDG